MLVAIVKITNFNDNFNTNSLILEQQLPSAEMQEAINENKQIGIKRLWKATMSFQNI